MFPRRRAPGSQAALAMLRCLGLPACLLAGAWEAGALTIQFRSGATNLLLSSSDARQQLLAVADDGRDLTREVTWRVEPAGLAAVDRLGRVTPLADGSGSVTAGSAAGTNASLPLTVAGAGTSPPIHFANQIVPIFTKNGCSSGGCHGKAAGQNGFRLSLLGFEPGEDYEHLVLEARARRLFPAAPERSLLLTKGTAQLPHGGGRRLEPGSDEYQLLLRWIAQGMPVGAPDAPTVSRLEVFPFGRTLAPGGAQQLVVTAHYTDGTTEDVTRRALYEPNDPDLARTDGRGLVTAFNQPGEFGVMVRYQTTVAVFRGTIPLGAPVTNLPPARNFVDELVFARLVKAGMPPSAPCDDATFLRRVTLDIAGRLPTREEVAAFNKSLAGAAPPARTAARDAVIERLLASTDYAEYFANKWAALLRNRRSEANQARGTYAFHAWIRDSLAANRSYDQFARELLTAAGDMADHPPVAWYRQVRTMSGQLEDVSQLFLGQRLQCAQCHHHPYEKWSQADYWSFGAFFSQVTYLPGSQAGEERIVHSRGVAQAVNQRGGQTVKPAGLSAAPVEVAVDDDPRESLADWMTDPKNPWFAKALANRYWKHFLGRGLVEPEDDLRETNPPTNPELLDALAIHFVAGGYDLKELIRTITRSSTYQLSSEPNEFNGRDRHHFSRFQPRRLPAEVLHDAVNAVTGGQSRFDGLPPGTRAVNLPDNSFNAGSYFLTVFGRPEGGSACECERSANASLSQSLHLLNSNGIQEQLAAETGRAAQLAADPREAAVKLRDLYRTAYARDPHPDEAAAALDHLARRTAAVKEGQDAAEASAARSKSRRDGWEDLLWAVLNTKEFLFNH